MGDFGDQYDFLQYEETLEADNASIDALYAEDNWTTPPADNGSVVIQAWPAGISGNPPGTSSHNSPQQEANEQSLVMRALTSQNSSPQKKADEPGFFTRMLSTASEAVGKGVGSLVGGALTPVRQAFDPWLYALLAGVVVLGYVVLRQRQS